MLIFFLVAPTQAKWIKGVLPITLAHDSSGRQYIADPASGPKWVDELRQATDSRYLKNFGGSATLKIYRATLPIAGCWHFFQLRELQEPVLS